MKWIIKYREVGSDRTRTTTHSGNKTREEIIEWFGLNGNDIDYYELSEEEE